MRKVLVGIPFIGNWVTFGIARFNGMVERINGSERSPVIFDVRFLKGSSVISFNVEFMRNCIAGMVLRDPEMTDLLFIDSDTHPAENMLDLLKHDADIVAGVYRIPDASKREVWSAYGPGPNADTFTHLNVLPTEPFDAAGAGTGAMLIKRRVLADARMRLAAPKEGEPPAIFRTVRGPHGACEVTDDLDFCRRARKAGYRILVDPRVRSEHVKEAVLR